MALRADTVNAWSAGDGGVIVALRLDNGHWQETWVSVDNADQLHGMLYLLSRPAREGRFPVGE
jgi:hypothetical protein